VINFGLVDEEAEGRRTGEGFNEKNVDLIFCHSATYSTSSTVLPVHQICKAPVCRSEPAADGTNQLRQIDNRRMAGPLRGMPGIGDFPRFPPRPHTIPGGQWAAWSHYTPAISLTNEVMASRKEAVRAWREIEEWIRAASVPRNLHHSRFGFWGNTYNGMLDMYSDFTLMQAQTGIHIEILEMCDLHRMLIEVTAADVNRKLEEVHEMFEISGDSPSDPIAKKPSEEQLEWSCRAGEAGPRI